jgi:hypothetical protein
MGFKEVGWRHIGYSQTCAKQVCNCSSQKQKACSFTQVTNGQQWKLYGFCMEQNVCVFGIIYFSSYAKLNEDGVCDMQYYPQKDACALWTNFDIDLK